MSAATFLEALRAPITRQRRTLPRWELPTMPASVVIVTCQRCPGWRLLAESSDGEFLRVYGAVPGRARVAWAEAWAQGPCRC